MSRRTFLSSVRHCDRMIRSQRSEVSGRRSDLGLLSYGGWDRRYPKEDSLSPHFWNLAVFAVHLTLDAFACSEFKASNARRASAALAKARAGIKRAISSL